MGSMFKTKTPAPPAITYSTYQDQVNGVEQVPVTQPDGTVTYVTRKLAPTAEQAAQAAQLEGIKTQALQEIQHLSSGSYAPDATTQASLNDWLAQHRQQLEKDIVQRTQSEEASLAQRGLADSSAGQAVRRQRALDQQQAEQTLQQQKDALLSDIRSQRLSLQQGLYSLASSGLDSAAARQYQAAVQSQSRAVAADSQRQASLLDYYTRLNATQSQSPLGGLFKAAFNTAFPGSSLGSLKL